MTASVTSPSHTKADLLRKYREPPDDGSAANAWDLGLSDDADLSFSKFSHFSADPAANVPVSAGASSGLRSTSLPFLRKLQMMSNVTVERFPLRASDQEGYFAGKGALADPGGAQSGPGNGKLSPFESSSLPSTPTPYSDATGQLPPESHDVLGQLPGKMMKARANRNGMSALAGHDHKRKSSVKVSLTPAQRVEKRPGLRTVNALNDFKIYEKIGRGAFADVFRGLNIKTNQVIAIKQITLEKEYNPNALMGEIDLLKILKHPNIVKYHGFVKTSDSLNVFLEYCAGGSLRQIYKKNGHGFAEAQIIAYVKPILHGLEYLHEQGVVHRDVKAANVLITENGEVKLADFGVATKVATLHNTVVGTPNWMAPETVLGGDGICTASDIWSLGATIIELYTMNPPYHDLNPMATLHAIGTDEHPPLPGSFSPMAKDFLLECFQKQSNLRINAKLLLRHRWLNSEASNSVRVTHKKSILHGDERIEHTSTVRTEPLKPQLSRAELLAKFAENILEEPNTLLAGSEEASHMELALQHLHQEEIEEQDPFFELAVDDFDTNEIEVQCKMEYLTTKLSNKVSSIGLSSEDVGKILVKITGRMLHLVKKYPVSHEVLIRDHGVITLMELLENAEEIIEEEKLWYHVLGVLNAIFDGNMAQVDNFSLLGGIPMIIRFSKLSFGLPVRHQVVKFVKILKHSDRALLMFVSSGGLRILTRFLEEDFDTSPDFPLVSIDCIHEILAKDLTRFKSDMCRILSKHGILFWFVVLLNRLVKSRKGQERLISRELVEQTIDKILEVVKLFGQAETRVRINVSNPDLFKLLIKVYPQLAFPRQLVLLKFFRSVSCITEVLRLLNSADILEFYVSLLRQYQPLNGQYKEVLNVLCPSLYNCCYLNHTRERELVKLGAVPLLRDLCRIDLPFRQFVLPIVCELVFCDASVHETLLRHDIPTTYYNLLIDPYWHYNAMDSLLHWGSQPNGLDWLSSAVARDCLVTGFLMPQVSNLEAALENYIRLLATSDTAVTFMCRPNIVDSIISKLTVYSKRPAAKLSLLRILHSLVSHASANGNSSVLENSQLKFIVKTIEATDSSILVKDLANRITQCILECR